MSGHTEGPWKVERHAHVDGELWLTVIGGSWDITSNGASRPGVIADAKYSAMSDEENEANARLIAAAPDLLEALKGLRDELIDTFAPLNAIAPDGDKLEDLPSIKAADAAIAKAQPPESDDG